MSSSSKQLEGLYGHKMDTAGRVAIPAELRPADDERLRFLSTNRRGYPLLALITQSDMDRRLADIDKLKEPGTDRDAPPVIKREMRLSLHSKCRPASINTQGKLQVPKDLATAAGLAAGGEVMLVGCGQYVEIWNAAQYAKAQVSTEAALAAYNAEAGVY